MNSFSKVANAYAKSLFQSIQQNSKLDETYNISLITSFEGQKNPVTVNVIREELALIHGFFLLAEDSKKMFQNPTFSEEKKLIILTQIFPGLTTIMKSFLRVLTDKNSLFLLPEIFLEFEKLLEKSQNSIRIKLIVASAFPENFETNLFHRLQNLTNATEIFLSVEYDPKILGGIILEYNSIAIDASILREFSLI